MDLIVVKLGGSLITKKRGLLEEKHDTIHSIAREFRNMKDKFKFILVHGGGSFGHPIAKKYNLNKGFKEYDQLIGVSKTRYYMSFLNQKILKIFFEEGVSLIPIHASSIFVTEDGKITSSYLDSIKSFLSINIIPIIFGDVVADRVKGFSILSGDQIVSYMALNFKAREAIFGTDVKGIYTSNPKTDANARLIRKIYYKNLPKEISIRNNLGSDVTGEMENKVKEILYMAERGISVKIGNLSIPGMLHKILYNLHGEYTIITPYPTKTIIM